MGLLRGYPELSPSPFWVRIQTMHYGPHPTVCRPPMSVRSRLGRFRALLPILLVALLTGCATTQQDPIKGFWLPPDEAAWSHAPARGIDLKHEDGSISHVTQGAIQNAISVKGDIERASGVHAELGLVDTEQPNAFALHHQGRPVVAISLSWLRELGQDRDALATTIGHELAHLHLGHSGDERKEREQIRMGASQVLGTLMNIAGVPMGGTIASIGVTAFTRSFTREEERAADDYGIRWAVAAGYDPCGRVRTMKMYQRMQADGAGLPILSTHPGAAERSGIANELSLKTRGTPCGI